MFVSSLGGFDLHRPSKSGRDSRPLAFDTILYSVFTEVDLELPASRYIDFFASQISMEEGQLGTRYLG